MRCLWCSNPESQQSGPEVAHRNSLCTKCGSCVEACPNKAISLNGDEVTIDRELCTSCGKCVKVCVSEALKMYGQEMSVEEVFQEVVRDKPFYQNSGGGVTASGGEPLFQADFVARLFERCKQEGIHTCLDSCGYAQFGAWEKVKPYTDLVLFDLKLMDPAAHREATGQSNELILDNLKRVIASGVPVIIRIPLIPDINDSEKNLKEVARFVIGLNGPRNVNLLPYHRLGESKYAMLDRSYHLADTEPLEHCHILTLKQIFESFELNCEVVT